MEKVRQLTHQLSLIGNQECRSYDDLEAGEMAKSGIGSMASSSRKTGASPGKEWRGFRVSGMGHLMVH